MTILQLNATSLSPSLFFLSLTSPAFWNPSCPFRALLDSGSSHSFVHEAFVNANKLKFSYLPKPIPLRMFDGSSMSSMEKKVHIPITFSTGEKHEMEFFVTNMTNLDKEYSLVLEND